jgi:DNA (cytosine-5)-methyltransferase 1
MTTSVIRFSQSTGLMSDDTETFGLLTLESLSGLTLSPEGFPVSQFSRAGKQLGEADSRWLWPEFFRVVAELRPRYVLMENVPGLIGLGMGRVLSDLSICGYDAEWDCLAAGFFGAPHLRERVYLLAYPNTLDGEARMGHIPNRKKPVFAGSHCESFTIWVQAADSFIGMDDGLSASVYKAEAAAYGNAVVPQIAEWVGRQILEAEKMKTDD